MGYGANMRKALTVIVPSYNMEAYLPKNLGGMVVDPALMEKLEVLVVNDGSKDRTSEIAHGFAEKWPGTFRVIDKENGNYGSCVNRGLAEATGFYVKVLDADDYVDTAAFADYLGVLDEEMGKGDAAADLVVTDYAKVDPDGHVLSRSRFGLGEGISTLADKPADSDWMAVQAVTYRTENLRRMDYRQTEGCSYTDNEWAAEPLSTVRRLRYVPRLVTHYLVGRAGQTMEDATFARNFGQVVRVAENLASRYDRRLREAAPEARESYRREVLGLIGTCYKHILFGYGACRVSADVAAFDDSLRRHEALYRDSEPLSIRIGRHLEFHHVREWRRKRSSRTVKLILYGIYRRLNVLCHALGRRFGR